MVPFSLTHLGVRTARPAVGEKYKEQSLSAGAGHFIEWGRPPAPGVPLLPPAANFFHLRSNGLLWMNFFLFQDYCMSSTKSLVLSTQRVYFDLLLFPSYFMWLCINPYISISIPKSPLYTVGITVCSYCVLYINPKSATGIYI